MLLKIAILEADNAEVRRVSAYFIETRFDAYYYGIFKSTFTAAEWPAQVTKMLERYGGKAGSYFNDSKASVFIAENDAGGLLDYVEAHLTPDRIRSYSVHFATLFPERTVALFQKAIDQYAMANTGRDHYENILGMLSHMAALDGERRGWT